MARMPGATWRPITVNYTDGGQESVRGVVVHIMAGTLAGTDSWFRNPKAKASSHFGTGKGGALYQWVDTSDRAWAQAGGNRDWLSVENEGKGGDKLTDDQLDANARVLAWAHKQHGVPLQLASSASGRGLAYHSLGGSAWGTHPSCPGSRIIAQLPEIVARAKKLAGASEELDMKEKDVADAVWDRDELPAPPDWPTAKTNKTWKGASYLKEIVGLLLKVLSGQAAQDKRLAAIEKKLGI